MKTKNSIQVKSVAFIIAVLLLCAVPDAALSQPPNDNFVNAIVLTGVSGQITGTNIEAARELGENSGYLKSVWWKWTAPETGVFYFDTHGSDFDTALAVYTGSVLESLTEIAYDNDDGLLFRADAGTVYHVGVGGDDSGHIVLNWRKADCPNDDFVNAIELNGVSGQTTGSNTEATSEPGEPYKYLMEKSVWYSWTAPETDIYYFDTDLSSFDNSLGIYTGSAVYSLTFVTDSIFQAQAGSRYYISVDVRYEWQSGGDIVLRWNKVIPRTAGQFEMELSGRAFVEGEKIESSAYAVFAFGTGRSFRLPGKGKIYPFRRRVGIYSNNRIGH